MMAFQSFRKMISFNINFIEFIEMKKLLYLRHKESKNQMTLEWGIEILCFLNICSTMMLWSWNRCQIFSCSFKNSWIAKIY